MNLKNVRYIDKFRLLPYPKSKMLIFGSGTMSLLGLRKNKDLDVWVTKDIFKHISKSNKFNKSISSSGDVYYSYKYSKIDIFDRLISRKENIKDQLKRSIIIYGLHFQSIEDVLEMKKYARRPKDLRDIKLIEDYLHKKVVENYLKVIQLLK